MPASRMLERDLQRLAREFAEASGGGKDELVELYSAMYEVSPQTVYRWAREGGYHTGRKRREDAGKKKVQADPEMVKKAAMIKYATSTLKYGSPMPAEVAIEISGAAESHVKPYQVNEMVRAMGLNRQALSRTTPHIVRSTERPNEEHQFDTSICRIWYLDKRKRIRVDRLRGMDKNKPQRGAPIVRYVLVDHFTHTFFFQYKRELESFSSSAGFLHQAWARKPDADLFPFCGVPKRMYLDQGPTFKNKHFKQLCENLGIELTPKQPTNTRSQSGKLGSPRAVGSVESAHWIIDRNFESRFRFQKPESLDELNDWAYRWCIWWNAAKRHSRYGLPRMQLWNSIRSDELRVPPGDFEVFITLAARWHSCKIYPDLTIRFKGERYLVRNVPVDLVHTKAEVMHSPFNFPEIQVRGLDGYLYNAHPLNKREPIRGGYYEHAVPSGTFRSPRDTTTERSQKLAERYEARDVAPFPDFAKRLERLRYMPKPGEEIEADIWPVAYPMMNAIGRIQEELCRPITIAENETLRMKYGECMRADEIEREVYNFSR